jgi:hypothetical protein
MISLNQNISKPSHQNTMTARKARDSNVAKNGMPLAILLMSARVGILSPFNGGSTA